MHVSYLIFRIDELMSLRLTSLFLAITAGVSAPIKAADFTVSQLSLITGIVDNSSGEIETAGDGTNQIQNPLVDHFSASLNGSATSMDVNLSWSDNRTLGRFLIESTQTADGNVFGETFSNSTARIVMTPQVPITIQVHGEYTYSCPADIMFATFWFSALGLSSGDSPFNELHSFSTTMGTGSGTFVIDGEFELLPTESWRLRGIMEIETGTGSAAHLATGSGFFNIQIVPEPATLLLVAVTFPFLRHQRRAATDSHFTGSH